MSGPLKLPAIPSAVLNFFSSQPDFPAFAGDMAEEFQQRSQSDGVRAAELWYWRESIRNMFALTAREICRTPGRTILIAMGAILAVNLVTGFYVATTVPAGYPTSVSRMLLRGFWIPMELDTFLLLQFTTSLAIGWVGSRLLPGREWAVALMFALVLFFAALPAAWHLLSWPGIFIPLAFWEFVVTVFALRLSGFWLGALCIRYWRKRSTIAGPRLLI